MFMPVPEADIIQPSYSWSALPISRQAGTASNRSPAILRSRRLLFALGVQVLRARAFNNSRRGRPCGGRGFSCGLHFTALVTKI
jgi:hypothetical protein